MSERAGPHHKKPRLREVLLATERQRREIAWNARHHPDPTKAQAQITIANCLSDIIGDVDKRGKLHGIDPQQIPLAGVIFENTSIPQTRQPAEIMTHQFFKTYKLVELSEEEKEKILQINSSGKLLQYTRMRLDCNQPNFANLIGKSRSWVDKVERNLRPFTLENLIILCEAFGIDIHSHLGERFLNLIISETRERVIDSQRKDSIHSHT